MIIKLNESAISDKCYISNLLAFSLSSVLYWVFSSWFAIYFTCLALETVRWAIAMNLISRSLWITSFSILAFFFFWGKIWALQVSLESAGCVQESGDSFGTCKMGFRWPSFFFFPVGAVTRCFQISFVMEIFQSSIIFFIAPKGWWVAMT